MSYSYFNNKNSFDEVLREEIENAFLEVVSNTKKTHIINGCVIDIQEQKKLIVKRSLS